MKIIEKNLHWFSTNIPILGERLSREGEDGQFPELLFEEDNGSYLITLDPVRCYMHSLYSRDAEMDGMFAEVDPQVDNIVLFGLGDGTVLEHIFNSFTKIQKILIIEPSIKLFREVLARKDLTTILMDDRKRKVFFCIDIDPHVVVNSLLSILDVTENTSVAFVDNINYRSLFAEYYRKFNSRALDAIRMAKINLRTTKVFAITTIKNAVANLSQPACPFEKFLDFAKEKPVIIVSAGPSLKKNMHLLNKAKEHAVVVAVGSAVRILESAGIKPHFRVGIDPNPHEGDIFQGLTDADIPLLFSNAVYPGVVTEYQGPVVRMHLITDKLGRSIYNKAQVEVLEVFSGPSVANAAVFAFCQAGCSKVVFVGQDMCIYDSKLHADGSDSGFRAGQNDVYVKRDIHGNEVISPLNYYSIKVALEDTVRAFSNRVQFVNATEGGLGIEGVENVTFEEVLSSLSKIPDISDVIKEILTACQNQSFESYIHELLLDVQRCLRLNDKILAQLSKVKDIEEFRLNRDKQIATSVFQKAQKYAKKLQADDFYRDVVEQTLEPMFIIYHNFWGQGLTGTEEEKLKSIKKILSRQAKEVQVLIKFLEHVILESKKNAECASTAQ